MTVNSEHMSSGRIDADRTASWYARGVDLSHDPGQPMRYLETVSAVLEESKADRQVRSAAPNAPLRHGGADLDGILAPGVVEAEGTGVESSAGPIAADPVQTASYAASRLLEIAAGNADALVEEARAQADQMVTEARAQANLMIQSSLADAKAREETMIAREEAQRVELERSRAETLRHLEERRAELEARVNELAEFESQYRDHLITYLSDQVRTLQGPAIAEGGH